MRTGYVPRDVPESATNVSLELNNSIRILNSTRSDIDLIEGTMSHTADEDNSSFTDDLSDSGPLTYIPSLTIVMMMMKWLKSIQSMIYRVNSLFL